MNGVVIFVAERDFLIIRALKAVQQEILNDYYKNHLSAYPTWAQRGHAEQYMLYPKNLGEHLTIDETCPGYHIWRYGTSQHRVARSLDGR